jgi:hypothetical protein
MGECRRGNGSSGCYERAVWAEVAHGEILSVVVSRSASGCFAPWSFPSHSVRRTTERRDTAGFLRNGFQILDQRPALRVGKQRADDTVSDRAILE